MGAVAFDQQGHFAAATSTGGTQDKLPGRVGDTPVIGAGTYADDEAGAASATGWGEGIMRVLLTRTAIDHLISNCAAEEAARRALTSLDRVGGKGWLDPARPPGATRGAVQHPTDDPGLGYT